MFRDFIVQYQNFILAAGLIFIALFGYFIFDTISKQGMQDVPITAVPADAKIEIDGAPVQQGSVLLPTGSHTLTASRDGFATKTVKFTIENDAEYDNFETILLAPVTDGAKEWVKNNSDQYGELAESKVNIDPVFTFIPYSDLIVDLSSDSTAAPVTINAKSLGLYRNAPIDYLKRSGLDPSNYRYTFNYKNPFEVGQNE